MGGIVAEEESAKQSINAFQRQAVMTLHRQTFSSTILQKKSKHSSESARVVERRVSLRRGTEDMQAAKSVEQLDATLGRGKPMRIVVAPVVILALAGCAGRLDYYPPYTIAKPGENVKLIERPRNAVWDASIPELGKRFFVINNLDRSSGIINVSYTGDPELYIDCGNIVSYVKNAQGERTYDFPAAKAQQHYEILNPNTGLFAIDRRMNLDGRINLIFEEAGPNATRVTANTRYVVARTFTARNLGNNIPHTLNDTITFNSGGRASFPSDREGKSSECAATGELERAILDAVR